MKTIDPYPPPQDHTSVIHEDKGERERRTARRRETICFNVFVRFLRGERFT